jgi:hypothetical protein
MEKFCSEAAQDRCACARGVQHHQFNSGSGLMVLKFILNDWYGEVALLHQIG